MSGVLGMLRIEFRRSLALLCFPLMVGAAWWFTSLDGIAGFYTWIEASGGVRETILLVGPMLGGLSAWMAGRDHRRKMGELFAVTPCSPVSRTLTTWAGTALWGVAVYAVLVVGIFALTYRNATWGAPLWSYLLVTFLAVLAHTSLGFAAGRYLPSRFTAPLVAIGLFAAQILPLGIMVDKLNWQLLSPAPNGVVLLSVFQEVPQVAGQQSLWLLGLAGVALAAVALKDRWRSAAAWGALGVAGAVTVVGFVTTVGVDPASTQPFSSEDLAYDPVCKIDEITVCVHPAYEKLLPEVTRTINEITAPIAGLPGVPKRALQVGPSGVPAKEMNAGDAVLLDVTILTWEDKEWFAESVVSGFVQDTGAMYGSGEGAADIPKPTTEDEEKCGKIDGQDPSTLEREVFEPSHEAREVVTTWMLEQTVDLPEGYSNYGMCSNADKLVDDFSSLKPSVREAWLKENFADLRAGKVTLKDLP